MIGNQEWLSENLRVTRYRNGDAIPTGHNDHDWSNTNNGAYAVYPHEHIDGLNSDAEVLEVYGALYNGFSVNDDRGLCPTGWSVPTDDDWTILTDYAGGLSVAGGKLKSTRTSPDAHPRWDSPNEAATDEYGFKALPGGLRHWYYGDFSSVGLNSNWWCSDTYGRGMGNNNVNVFRFSGVSAVNGQYVRCIKDN